MSDRMSRNCASHGSAGVSAPSAYRKNKTTGKQLQDDFPSYKNDDKTDWDRLSAPHDNRRKNKRVQSRTRQRIGCRKNNFGNWYEDMDLEEIEIERIDVTELKKKRTPSVQKGKNKKKDTDLEKNKIEEADFLRKLKQKGKNEGHSGKDVGTESSDSEDTSSSEVEIEKIDEAESRKIMSKIGTSTGQELNKGHSAATCSKNFDGARKNIFLVDLCSSSSEDCRTVSDPVPDKRKANSRRDSDMREADESSSEKENSDEDMYLEKNEIVKVDESELMRRKKVDADLSRKRNDNENNSSAEYISSYTSSTYGISSRTRSKTNIIEKPSEVDNVSLDSSDDSDSSSTDNDRSDDEDFEVESSHNSDDIELLSSSVDAYEVQNDTTMEVSAEKSRRTRSKTNIIEKPSEVDNVSLDSSDDSDSSSTDNDRSDDEDFEVESSHNSDDIELVSSSVVACEVQNDTMMEVSAEKSENCSKQERNEVKCASEIRYSSNLQNEEKVCRQSAFQRQAKHASKIGCSSNLQTEEKVCRQPAFQRRKAFTRKKQLSHNESSTRTRGRKACKTYEVEEENEEINRNLGDDANAEKDMKEKNGKIDNLPEFTSSKHFDTEKNCEEAKEDNALQQKKSVSSSHLEDDFHHSKDDYDDIQQKLDATRSHFHGHGEDEKLHEACEMKKLTKKKQAPSKQFDFCRVLADSILESRPNLEMQENDEEVKQAPASQTQCALPLKFRFEDQDSDEVEKTEYEKEVESLFAELDFCWALSEMGSFNYPEDDQDNANSPDGETQHARCARGKHELIVRDDEGLICLYCHHVELEPKYILPQWIEKNYRESERKQYSETDQVLEFDGVHLQSGKNDISDFSNAANATVWSIKPDVLENMYEHQVEGFEFLWKNLAGSININELKNTDPGKVGGCIISHAPGTGKTRLTIVFLETYLKLFPNCLPVIICPASMLLTWEEEFKKWNVDFPFYNLNNLEFLEKEHKTALKLLGAGSKRLNTDALRMVKLYSWSMGRSILGISYSLFGKLTGAKYINKKKTSKKREKVDIDDTRMESLRKILLEKPGLVVLDEGHTPRNQRSNIWNVLLKLKTEKRVILSGTPFQNSFAELFNTLRLVRPAVADILAQEKTFAEIITPRRKYSQSTVIYSEAIDRAVEKLKLSMSPFVHVHKGTILKQSLPGLRDCVVLLKPPPLQKSLIEKLEGSPSTFEFEHKIALISVHPYLFQQFDSTDDQRIGIDMAGIEATKFNPNEGVKTKFILELIRLSMVMKEKVLIFSQYIQPLELIKEQLKELFKWVDGKQILVMHGKLEQKQRQIMINVFNDSQSESKVMLASTKCCSEGISLVGASRVVLLDVVWNPSVERQAICRAYRIGQKKFVYTYHLMTLGTSEADKYCRQAEKERLSELVFTSSSNESNKQKQSCLGIEDRILEEMVGHEKLKEMFEKIINQPKDADLVQSFGLIS